MAKEMKKVLIAEDEKPMAKALELKLSKSGFDAVAVFDGEAAVKELEKNTYDVALLDLMMPKLDGFGVLESLKDKKIKTKIIITSNLSQEEDIKRTKNLGAVDYLVKSNTPIAKIVEKVNSLL